MKVIEKEEKREDGRRRTYCSSSAKDASGSELAALNPVLELPIPFLFSFPFSTVFTMNRMTVSSFRAKDRSCDQMNVHLRYSDCFFLNVLLSA